MYHTLWADCQMMLTSFEAENMKLNILAALSTVDALEGGHLPAHQVHLALFLLLTTSFSS